MGVQAKQHAVEQLIHITTSAAILSDLHASGPDHADAKPGAVRLLELARLVVELVADGED